MLLLQTWFTASLLFASLWALFGLLLGTPGPARCTQRRARSEWCEVESKGEAA